MWVNSHSLKRRFHHDSRKALRLHNKPVALFDAIEGFRLNVCCRGLPDEITKFANSRSVSDVTVAGAVVF